MKNVCSCMYIIPLLVLLPVGCEDSITDFGYDGEISGMVQDQAGNPVSGSLTTEDFEIMVMAEGDLEPVRIRVRGDGTYANVHLYPQVYDVWPVGPIESQVTEQNPVTVDLTGPPVTRDFTVTPFLTIPAPTAGQPSGNSVEVSYSINPSAGHDVQTGANRVIWASTASWPDANTGTALPNTHTITTQLPANSGTVTVDGLMPGRSYYLRIGARAVGTTRWNLSGQTEITNP